MQSERDAHAKRIQELQKEDKNNDNDNNDNEPSRKKARPVEHLGPGFGIHSTKTRGSGRTHDTKKESSTKDYTERAEKNSF